MLAIQGFRFDFRVQKALLSHRPHPILCMESWKKLSVVRKNLGKSFSGYKSNVYQTDFAIVTTGLRNRASKWHGRSRSKSGFQVEIQYWDGTSGSQTWFHFVHGKLEKMFGCSKKSRRGIFGIQIKCLPDRFCSRCHRAEKSRLEVTWSIQVKIRAPGWDPRLRCHFWVPDLISFCAWKVGKNCRIAKKI